MAYFTPNWVKTTQPFLSVIVFIKH